MAESEKQQHLYKVLVIGDYAVGKTSIIKRYCEGYFTPNYKLTIGVDFAVKVVEWDDNTRVSLQVSNCFSHTSFWTRSSTMLLLDYIHIVKHQPFFALQS